MKKTIFPAVAVILALGVGSSVSAATATWDFAQDATDFRDKNLSNTNIDAANGGFEGTFDQVYGGATSTIDGISLTASAFRGFDGSGDPENLGVTVDGELEEITTFMDAQGGGPAGLGVCSTGFDVSEDQSRCSSQYDGSLGPKNSGDDNLVFPEILKLAFSGPGSATEITDLLVYNGNHQLVDGHLLISTTGEAGSYLAYSMTAGVVDLTGLAQSAMYWFTSLNDDLNNPAPEIYLGTITVSSVPVPAALPLLLAGLGGLGFMGRRRRKTA